jgi:hypothetical protein
MKPFIRTTIVQDVTPAADGSYTYDLPVNPVSHINLIIKCLNVTNEATVPQILDLITNIEVLHRGTSIIQCSARDLYALDHILFRNPPMVGNQVATDNATRYVGLTIPFGRKIFSGKECFPMSKAGELKLRLTVDIATAEADGLILLVEATELPAETPTRFLKYTTLTKTPSATGAVDVPLPISYEYAGIVIWGTTIPTGTAWTATIDQAKLLGDNTEVYYSLTNWEALHSDLLNRIGHRPGHIVASTDDHIANWCYLDFDPMDNDDLLLNSKSFNSLTLRITAGDTNPLRVLPVELVPATI